MDEIKEVLLDSSKKNIYLTFITAKRKGNTNKISASKAEKRKANQSRPLSWIDTHVAKQVLHQNPKPPSKPLLNQVSL